MDVPTPFYVAAGTLLSPGDFFDSVPYIRIPSPIRVARKPPYSLPKTYKVQGEMREILDPERHEFKPPLDFDPPGEEILVAAKKARAIFLTWGSEVEDDERHGQLRKKDWLIAPVFPLRDLEGISIPGEKSGEKILIRQAIQEKRSPRFFPLDPFPNETDGGAFYVDFRKICCLAATHLYGAPRRWHLAPNALDDFYHQLIWFFTRKKIFLGAVPCPKCGEPVDLGITFEGQPIEPEA